ncbi:hypothetical protein [Rhodococcoides fascians]|uniref:hypothetical protein n=1 Tax=Rhodococcoides fascians TaxID=1828 RepID=UPI00056AB8CE|nr:hypothetical protein [Rhodococcus fascians]
MTAPEVEPSTVPTVEEFRKFVNADASDDDALQRDLDTAVEMLDNFCRNPMRPIPPATRRRWNLLVGAELFDETKGPKGYTDSFGNQRQARSSRDPLNVIIRQARHYISPF